jgi:hypothetical protein|tara:strand:+ start:2018 stop:2365 length:348 start_codon:yes stop_codon:yes gene_type:complete
MDERLERALEFGNYRTTVSNQKRNVIARMQTLQLVHHNNGSFTANPQTISFIQALVSVGKGSSVVLDTKENPIEIADLKEFLELLVGAYSEGVNEYKVQMDKIQKARNIKKIMDW